VVRSDLPTCVGDEYVARGGPRTTGVGYCKAYLIRGIFEPGGVVQREVKLPPAAFCARIEPYIRRRRKPGAGIRLCDRTQGVSAVYVNSHRPVAAHQVDVPVTGLGCEGDRGSGGTRQVYRNQRKRACAWTPAERVRSD